MRLGEAFGLRQRFMMEGALGERIKREFGLRFDDNIAMAALIDTDRGRAALVSLWNEYRSIADTYGMPFLAATPTRRANRERMEKAGRDARLIRENVQLLREVQRSGKGEMYVGGLMGCRGDAYTGWDALDAQTAREFHRWQAQAFREAGADFLMAGIMPTIGEAVGMAQAMADTGLDYIISLTIRRDGRMIDGTSIDEAIGRIDAETDSPPVCLMTNCVHPSIAREALMQPFNRTQRVQLRFLGIQANTSPLPYDMLDGAKELFVSPPEEFAEEMAELDATHRIKIVGGCCGTDGRHMKETARRMGEQGI